MQSQNLALDIRTIGPAASLDDAAWEIAETTAHLGREIVAFSKLTEVRSGKTGELLYHEARVQVVPNHRETPGTVRGINYLRLDIGMHFGPGQRIDIRHQ